MTVLFQSLYLIAGTKTPIEIPQKHRLENKRIVQEDNKTEKQVPLREPDLLIILTGGSMAYTRPDGVKVIPLACLKD